MEWETICGDKNWSLIDASVVCKHLGFSNAITTSNKSFVPGSNIVWMRNVECSGSELSVSSCGHNGLNQGNCSDESASVCCQGKIMQNRNGLVY